MEHAATTQLNREDFFIARDYDDQVVVYENEKCYVLMARDGHSLLNAYEIVRYDHIGKLDYVHTGCSACRAITRLSTGSREPAVPKAGFYPAAATATGVKCTVGHAARLFARQGSA